jgi:hypothetical protein
VTREKAPKKGFQGQVFILFILIAAVIFLPTTIFLALALLPTFVAAIADRSKRKYKALTVGAMNLAGCMPFMISLWTKGQTINGAIDLITNPQTFVVVWMAAAVGYLIDWAMSGIVMTMMMQRSAGRLKEIQKRQAELVQRWGDEVSGDIPLDRFGFRIEKPDDDDMDDDVAREKKEKAAKNMKKNR